MRLPTLKTLVFLSIGGVSGHDRFVNQVVINLIGGMTQLLYLHLETVMEAEAQLDLSPLTNLRRLKALDVENGVVDQNIWNCGLNFAQMTDLRFLRMLQYNDCSYFTHVGLEYLTNLKSLWLYDSLRFHVENLAPLTNLTTLALWRPSEHQVQFLSTCKFPYLTSVNIITSSINSASLLDIATRSFKSMPAIWVCDFATFPNRRWYSATYDERTKVYRVERRQDDRRRYRLTDFSWYT